MHLSSSMLPLSVGANPRLSQPLSPTHHLSLPPSRFKVSGRACRRQAAAAPTVAASNSSLARITQQADRRRLSDPAKIGGKATHTITVQDRGGAVSLERYMRLPPEAYAQLEPDMIVPLGGSRFLLRLPRVSMFHVWVEVELEVSVSQRESPPRVVLESHACHLPGSAFFQGIEGRFALHFYTELTWRPGGAPAGAQQAQQQQLLLPVAGPAAIAAGPVLPPAGMVPLHPQDTAVTLWDKICQRAVGRSSNGGGEGGSGGGGGSIFTGAAVPWMPLAAAGGPRGEVSAAQDCASVQEGEISGSLNVEVWSEVPPPFSFLPREVVEGTCNAVLRSLINALLPLFMKRLGEDYEKWAMDVSYREARAQEAAVRQAAV